jgi:ABC-type antimicrobial peptide transport system permease subunit
VVVYNQVQFARNRPVGYNRDGLITIPINDPEIRKKLLVIRTELLNSGVATNMALSSSPLTAIWNITGGYDWRGKDPNLEGEFAMNLVSPEFAATVGLKVLEGRDFSADIPSDTIDAVLISRAAAKYMGLKDPVGQQLVDVNDRREFKWSKTIIGVVDDMVMSSPYEPVLQMIYYYRSESFGQIQIRLAPDVGPVEGIAKIKSIFNNVVPTAPFSYTFADEGYALKFAQEERVGKLAGVFAVLAIGISCLGLFGLSSFVAEQRTKEIGIRKVMGASVLGLWKMLSKDFIVLVIISCLVAIPIGYYFMDRWLETYKYRTEISPWAIMITCSSAIFITLLTVSYQSLKAASMNPVKSLRSE